MTDYIALLLSIAENNKIYDESFVLIARTMLSHLYELGTMQNKKLAELCFVDASSITRFVRYLGFTSYSDFKKYFKNYAEQYGSNYYFNEQFMSTNHRLAYHHDLLLSMSSCLNEISPSNYEEVAEAIMAHSTILLCGDRYSQLACQNFQYKLLSLSVYAQTFKDIQRQKAFLEQQEPGLMIQFSASARVVTLLEDASQHKWKTILISRSEKSKEFCDTALLYRTHHEEAWSQHSTVDFIIMNMMIDEIIYYLAKKILHPHNS